MQQELYAGELAGEYDGREPDGADLEDEDERVRSLAYGELGGPPAAGGPIAPECVLAGAIRSFAESYDIEGEPERDEDGIISRGSVHEVFRLSPRQALAEGWRHLREILRPVVFAHRPSHRPSVRRHVRVARRRRRATASRGSPGRLSAGDGPLPQPDLATALAGSSR